MILVFKTSVKEHHESPQFPTVVNYDVRCPLQYHREFGASLEKGYYVFIPYFKNGNKGAKLNVQTKLMPIETATHSCVIEISETVRKLIRMIQSENETRSPPDLLK